MILSLQHDQTFATTYHQKFLRCAVQMTSVRMVKNAAMISAKARMVRSIANVQKVVDVNVEEAEVEESNIINMCYI